MNQKFQPALILFVLLVFSPLFAVEGELFFDSAKVEMRLIDPDSLTVQVSAGAEDLMNTVWVFPSDNSDKTSFRLYERKLEAYFLQRIPVWIDGNRLDLKVVQWKPGGKGRKDGFDSASINTEHHFITFGSRLPKQRENLTVRADLWVERDDAAETTVEFSLLRGETLLKSKWSRTEKTLKFSIHPDTLAARK